MTYRQIEAEGKVVYSESCCGDGWSRYIEGHEGLEDSLYLPDILEPFEGKKVRLQITVIVQEVS